MTRPPSREQVVAVEVGVDDLRRRRGQPRARPRRRTGPGSLRAPPARPPGRDGGCRARAAPRATSGSRPLPGSVASSGRSRPKFCRSHRWVRRAPGWRSPRSATLSRASVARCPGAAPGRRCPGRAGPRRARRSSGPAARAPRRGAASTSGAPSSAAVTRCTGSSRRGGGEVQQDGGLEGDRLPPACGAASAALTLAAGTRPPAWSSRNASSCSAASRSARPAHPVVPERDLLGLRRADPGNGDHADHRMRRKIAVSR